MQRRKKTTILNWSKDIIIKTILGSGTEFIRATNYKTLVLKSDQEKDWVYINIIFWWFQPIKTNYNFNFLMLWGVEAKTLDPKCKLFMFELERDRKLLTIWNKSYWKGIKCFYSSWFSNIFTVVKFSLLNISCFYRQWPRDR